MHCNQYIINHLTYMTELATLQTGLTPQANVDACESLRPSSYELMLRSHEICLLFGMIIFHDQTHRPESKLEENTYINKHPHKHVVRKWSHLYYWRSWIPTNGRPGPQRGTRWFWRQFLVEAVKLDVETQVWCSTTGRAKSKFKHHWAACFSTHSEK